MVYLNDVTKMVESGNAAAEWTEVIGFIANEGAIIACIFLAVVVNECIVTKGGGETDVFTKTVFKLNEYGGETWNVVFLKTGWQGIIIPVTINKTNGNCGYNRMPLIDLVPFGGRCGKSKPKSR